jgi:RNA polymerase sigma-70 factor, ECF subfamily
MKMDFDGNHPSAHGNGCNAAAGARRADLDDNLQQDILALVPGLRRYAWALTHDVAAADDLVQDCLCRALAKIHLWERGTDLRAWLSTILYHQHISEIRRTSRRGVPVALEDAVATALATAADALCALQLRDLDRAIASLPETQRQVILLAGLEGMTYEDVAATLGIPVGTVSSRLARGRATLSRLLDSGEDAARSPSAVSASRHAHALSEARNRC